MRDHMSNWKPEAQTLGPAIKREEAPKPCPIAAFERGDHGMPSSDSVVIRHLDNGVVEMTWGEGAITTDYARLYETLMAWSYVVVDGEPMEAPDMTAHYDYLSGVRNLTMDGPVAETAKEVALKSEGYQRLMQDFMRRQEAPKPAPEWIAWNGAPGKVCPVPREHVSLRYSDGTEHTYTALHAGDLCGWDTDAFIAYKVVRTGTPRCGSKQPVWRSG